MTMVLEFRLIKKNKIVGYCNFNHWRPKYIIKKDFENISSYNPPVHDKKDMFTSFYDRKKKKIYEGDIIKWISIGTPEGNIEDVGIETDMGTYKIVFKDGKFTTLKPELPVGHFRKNEIEVIGNIHENSDLLK